MTVLGALMRGSIQNPNTPLNGGNLAAWFGGNRTSSGVTVTEERVLGIAAWYRAVAILSGTLAALPMHVFRRGTRTRHNGVDVLYYPNDRDTQFEFWVQVFAHAVSWGTGYIRAIRNRGGVIVEMWPVHPSLVTVEKAPITARNGTGKQYRVRRDDGTDEILTPYELIALPYLSIDGRAGVNPLQVFRETLGIGIAAEDTSASFYANGARLQGVLQTDQKLGKDTVDDIQGRWESRTAGSANAGRTVVLDYGLKFNALAIPPADAELLVSRKFTVTEISRITGLPPHLLGDLEKSTSWGSGIEQQMIGLVQFTFLPWIKMAEQRITTSILPGGRLGNYYAELNVSALLRGDAAARAAFYKAAITDGWMSRNEVRSKENMERGPDSLDDFIVPSNLSIITIDGELINPAAVGKGASE